MEGDIDQGIAYYKKALYYNWHYADAMYNLGVAYGEMLKFDMVSIFYFLLLQWKAYSTGFPLDWLSQSDVVFAIKFCLCRQLCSMNLLSTSIPIVQRRAIIWE